MFSVPAHDRLAFGNVAVQDAFRRASTMTVNKRASHAAHPHTARNAAANVAQVEAEGNALSRFAEGRVRSS